MAGEGARDRRHEMSWPLRRLVGRSCEAELLEPAAEDVGVQPEDLGRAAWPVDDPVSLPEDGTDMTGS